MAIVFDHAVKYNGKFYPPNTPIEEESVKTPPEEKGETEKKPRTKKVTKDA